jgi:hypothetical protein
MLEYNLIELEEIKPNQELLSSKLFQDIDKELSRIKCLNYIAYVYHPKTPLARIGDDPKFNKFLKRKFVAAQAAEFPTKKNGTFIQEYENVLLGYNESVNLWIINYLKL